MTGHGFVFCLLDLMRDTFDNILLRSGSAVMMDRLLANSALYSSKSACYDVKFCI